MKSTLEGSVILCLVREVERPIEAREVISADEREVEGCTSQKTSEECSTLPGDRE